MVLIIYGQMLKEHIKNTSGFDKKLTRSENCCQEDEDECRGDKVDGIMDNFKALKNKLVQFINEAAMN